MIAVIKRPGQQPELIEMDATMEAAEELLGGAAECIPALFGAMALRRKEDTGLEFNCHFIGKYFYGSFLIAGRGPGDAMVDLPEHLHRIMKLALREVSQR